MFIGERFYEILHSEVLTSITKASNSIASDMVCNRGDAIRAYDIGMQKDFLEEMRLIINCYIDCQLETFEKIEGALHGTDEEQIRSDKVTYQGIETLDNITIGEKIKALRKRNNLTQIEFAKMFGVTNAHISGIEKGKGIPSEMFLRFIREKMGVNESFENEFETEIKKDNTTYQGIEVLDYLTFGEKFKALRKRKNLTQAQFAKMFGVSRPYISRLENGKENPSEMLLLLIIEKTGVSETWIRNGGQR